MTHRHLAALIVAAAAVTAPRLAGLVAAADAVPAGAAVAPAKPPAVPTGVTGRAGVKTYLVDVVAGVQRAAADLKAAGTAYAALAARHGGASAAAAADPQATADLVRRLRDAYQRIDSYGYEYVEGIVAGVPALSKYDVELDSGVPAAKPGEPPAENVATLVIRAGPLTVDKEGSLNNFLIEPTVFGTNPRFTVGQAVLPGLGDKPVGLPNPQLVVALADYAVPAYARLRKDCDAWQPTDADLFQVLANMTPTLADYFEEWKEAKKGGAGTGGRFVAVSRVSDMRGIMTSVRLAWLAVRSPVTAKDAPLADSVTAGYDRVLQFIDTVDAREQQRPLTVEAIDALGTTAKERADKLTVQATQAAALCGVSVEAK